MEAMVDRQLEEALREQDAAQARYEAVIGTSAEMGAYLRLRRASQRVAKADRVARRAEAAEQQQLVRS